METFFQLLIRSLETGSVYALCTLGVIIVFKTSHIVNFAAGSFGMFCTYVTTSAVMRLGCSVYVAALIGILCAVVLGVLIDVVIIRHTAKITPVAKQIITLGIFMVILGVCPMLFGIELMSLPKFVPMGSIELGATALSFNGLLNIVIGLAVMGVLYLTLQKSKLGLAIRTTASSETTARMMGIPTKMVTMFAWGLAGVLTCMSGIMIAPSTTVSMTLLDAVFNNALVACVLGGFQTFYGPMVGAYIIGISKNLIAYYVSSVWGEPLLYLLVFTFTMIRPNGLFGKAYVKKV